MTIRTERQLLAVLCVLLVGSVAAAVHGLAFRPVEVPEPAVASARNTDDSQAGAPKAPRPASHYAVIARRNLLKPLFDVKPVKTVRKAPPPKLDVTLEGTMVEPGFTYGIFRDKRGQTQLVGVGKTIAGAEVLAIRVGEATLRHHGREVTLKVPEKGGSR